MKKTLTLLFTLLLTSATFAQKLTDAQIKTYLDALQKEQIITEFGKDAFLKAINNEDKILNQRLTNSPLGSLGKIPDSLSKSRTAILGFVGVFELLRSVGSAADEMIQIREMSEKMLGERMLFKPEIEGDMKLNNPLTFLGLSQNLRPSKERYIALANTLKSIQLIDDKVFADLMTWLKKDQIKLIKDFGFFIYAAKQTYFYDNYASLKATQLGFIDSLVKQKMLPIAEANKLKASYKAYELKSRIDILALCQNAIILSADQKNLTREEIYQKLFQEIKGKLVPSFQANSMKLVEMKNETTADEVSGVFPFKNPLTKNKKSYQLSYLVDDKAYSQKADTDFTLLKTIQKSLPPDVDIDSSIIQTYANVFSFLTGLTNKDFQSVNDYLIDQHSSKRVVVVSNEYNPFVPIIESRKILLLVDSTQNYLFSSKIKENALFGKFFGEKINFSNKNSRDSIYTLIADFQKNDILPTTENTTIETLIQALRFEPSKLENIERNIVISFPEIIAKIDVVPTDEGEKLLIYRNFMRELSRISKGKFNPEKVNDNFGTEIPKGNKVERILQSSFKFKGKKYETTYNVQKRYHNENEKTVINQPDRIYFMTEEWLIRINQALSENDIDGQFYKIKSSQNFSGIFTSVIDNIIFLNKTQLNFLETKHPKVLKDPAIDITRETYDVPAKKFNVEDFAKALNREKMLANVHLKDLKTAKEPSDILKNSEQVVVIDMNELSNKSDTELYAYTLNKVNQKLLPKAKFGEIQYFRETLDSTEYNFEQQNISAQIDGKTYKQTLFSSLQKVIQNNLDSLKKPNSAYFPAIGENQFKVINDYLTDIASPQRLVIVCDYRSPKLSFVLFDSTQASLVAETLPNNYVDFLMYNRKFSRDSLNLTFDELHRIGLIEPLNATEKENLIIELRKFQVSGLSLLQKLKKVVVQSNIWDVESYKTVFNSMIDSLKSISRNQFNPTNLTDNFAKTLKKSNYSDRTFTYSFMMPNGQKYEEKQFVKALEKPKSKADKINYELLDFDTTKLLVLVNKALNDANSEGSFYEVFDTEAPDESIGPKFIFLNSKQYRWIKAQFPELFQSYTEDRNPDIDEIKEEK